MSCPDLIRDFGTDAALALARATADSVDAIGAWCDANRIDAWFRKAGYVIASASPAHDRAFDASSTLRPARAPRRSTSH